MPRTAAGRVRRWPTSAEPTSAARWRLQPDGKIVVAGSSDALVNNDFAVARFTNPGGQFDASYGGGTGKTLADLGGNDRGSAVALQPDGKIIVAGTSTDSGGNSDFAVARFTNPQGTYDPTYAGGTGRTTIDFGGADVASAAVLQPDGKLIVVGTTNARGGNDFALARLQPDGSLDSTFGNAGKVTFDLGGQDQASAVALQSDGKTVVAGTSDALGGLDFAVARFLGDRPSGGGGGSGGGGSGGGGGGVPRCAGQKATIIGTGGADKLSGTRRADVIVGLGGNDKIKGGGGNDLICAGNGNDKVDGGSGNDRIYGQNGNDRVSGGPGNDKIDGGGSNDTLAGQSGNDTITGGPGKDTLSGGPGKNKTRQ